MYLKYYISKFVDLVHSALYSTTASTSLQKFSFEIATPKQGVITEVKFEHAQLRRRLQSVCARHKTITHEAYK